MKSTKLALALAGLLAVSGTGVYAASNDTTSVNPSTSEAKQCERGDRGGKAMFGERGGGHTALIEALGLTEEEVKAAHEQGQRLHELAEEKGITIEAFIDAILVTHEEKLASAVEDGKLTQEEADEILAEHTERFADVTSYEDFEEMRGERKGKRGGHGHGPRHGDSNDSSTQQ